MKKSTGRRNSYDKPTFYVVTRDGRRAWYKDYWTLGEAQHHVNSLVSSLKRINDPGYKRVIIIETNEPEKIT